MIDENKTPDYRNLNKVLDVILYDISEAHNLLSKSELRSEKYNQISILLAKSKLKLNHFYLGIVYLLDGIDIGQEMYNESKEEIKKLNGIIELKEIERRQWADMCISKQRIIDEMKAV